MSKLTLMYSFSIVLDVSAIMRDEMIDQQGTYAGYEANEFSKFCSNENTAVYEPDEQELIHCFGLCHNEARVYLYLLRNVDKRADEISESLHILSTNTHFILAELNNNGLITATLHYPTRYNAVPFHRMVKLTTQGNMLLGIGGRTCKTCDKTIDFDNTTRKDAFFAELCDACYVLQTAIVEDMIVG